MASVPVAKRHFSRPVERPTASRSPFPVPTYTVSPTMAAVDSMGDFAR